MEKDDAETATLQGRAVEVLSQLPQLARNDEILAFRGRYVSLEFVVRIGERPCFVTIVNGRVERVDVDPQKMRSSAFTIAAESAAWERFWRPMPEPGWNDLFAMNKRGHAVIEGNLVPFMQNLQYFKDVMALPRQIWVDNES
jgi:hypothetical protein